MRTYGYYSFIDNRADDSGNVNSCSIASDERPLIINCAGSFGTDFPFTTNNPSGRLDYYLMCVISGELFVSCAEDSVTLSAGNVIIIPPCTPYKYTNASKEHMSYLWVHFTGSHAKSTLDSYGFEYFPNVSTTSDINSITLRFKAILDAYSRNDKLRDAELSALLDMLLISLARSLEQTDTLGNELVRSMRLINSSYNTDIKIPDLARTEHLSVSRYNFLFKRKFGVSPTKYILKLRMNCARDLLRNTDLSIKQISQLSGYNDSHFFSKIFKTNIGISPSEYRDMAGSEE